MTTTHDTAAALEAAIDAHKHDIIDHAALHRAITAHVEAEVARRLAAAPDVEQWLGGIVSRALRGCSGNRARADLMAEVDRLRSAIAADKVRAVAAAHEMAPEVDDAITNLVDEMIDVGSGKSIQINDVRNPMNMDEVVALRAAIAADKARAVEAEATRRDAEIFGLRARLAIVAEIAEEAISSASEAPDCHEQVQDYRVRMRKWRMSKPARPTPDEARRLAESILAAVDMHSRDQRAGVVERIILRALGVEA